MIGRFYSNDPVDTVLHGVIGDLVNGFNRYRYAKNNPYKYTDPTGALDQCGISCNWGQDWNSSGWNNYYEDRDFFFSSGGYGDQNTESWEEVSRLYGMGKSNTFIANNTIKLSVSDEKTFLGLANGVYFEIDFTSVDKDFKPIDGVYPDPAFKGSLMRMLPDRVFSVGVGEQKILWTVATLNSQPSCDNCGPPILTIHQKVTK